MVTQIRERTEWLAEMEYLGQAGPHRDIIKDQIAERMRALDALGIDSECSTPKSSASGFSTRRSREDVPLRQPTPGSNVIYFNTAYNFRFYTFYLYFICLELSRVP